MAFTLIAAGTKSFAGRASPFAMASASLSPAVIFSNAFLPTSITSSSAGPRGPSLVSFDDDLRDVTQRVSLSLGQIAALSLSKRREKEDRHAVSGEERYRPKAAAFASSSSRHSDLAASAGPLDDIAGVRIFGNE